MICGWQELAASDKRWTVHPLMEEMKAKAKAEGLWNLWISPDLATNIRPALPEGQDAPDTLLLGAGLSNLVNYCSFFMSLCCQWSHAASRGEHSGEIVTQKALASQEYAFLSEEMGRVVFASEAFNCSAPDTGNMEVLARYQIYLFPTASCCWPWFQLLACRRCG